MQTIGEALRDDAHRKLMTNFQLKDWQLENPASDRMAFVEPSRKMAIEVDEFRINLYAGDKLALAVWIELNNGELTVHAYDEAHEEPTTLRIGDKDTVIERHTQ